MKSGKSDQGGNSAPLGRRPDVTVLMSCFNAGRWLKAAIDSVLCQTFENFEFLIVDDGSTDDTPDIIRAYRQSDRRIVAIRKENTGLQDSLNVGIENSRGAWIARLDADDLCEPDRLAEQLTFVRGSPDVVLLGAGFVEIDEQGRAIKKHSYPTAHRDLVRHLERLKRFFPHSSAFYRRDAASKAGAYNTRIRRAEDWGLWTMLASQGRIACLPKPLVRIRKHSNQISLENHGHRQLCDAMAAMVCHFLRKAGCNDPSADARAEEWVAFLNWIENRIEGSTMPAQRKAWTYARAAYFSADNRLIGAFQFGIRLLNSGHAGGLLWEKFFGSPLPERLAQEWMKRA